MFDTLKEDFRHSASALLERPGFALTVVLTLALGVGANVAIFSVLKAVLLDALPYPDSARIVALAQRNGDADQKPVTIGYATLMDVQKQVPAFSAVAVSSSWQPNLAGASDAKLLDGQSVTRDFFSVLGVKPQLGRLFTAEEDQPDRNDVVLLSAGLWNRSFNHDPGVIGRRIVFGSRSYTVIGVLPNDFDPLLPATLGRPPDVWRPLGYNISLPYACRTCMHLQAIARLAPGASLAAARTQLNALSPALIREFANEYPGDMRFEMHRLREAVVGDASHSLWLLFAGVGLVLLIACVDIASLLSLRAASRGHELSVRAALGAECSRLTRLMLSESFLLGAIGGLLGIALAFGMVNAIPRLGSMSIPRLDAVRVDSGVLVFASLLTLAVALATGLWPAWRASRPRLDDAFKEAGRVSSGRASGSAQSTVVIVQIALACALTLGALLIAHGFARLVEVDPGFAATDVQTVNVAMIGSRYADHARVSDFLSQLEARAGELPGIERVGAVTPLPLGGGWDSAGFHIKDRPLAGPEAPEFDRAFVTPGYFKAIGIPLHAGRYIAADDRLGQPLVAVVNDALARREWPGTSALGKQIQLGSRDDKAPWFTVVGVVGDVRQHSLDLAAEPQVYIAHAQSDDPPKYMTLAVHSSLSAVMVASEVKHLAHSLDPGVPVYDAESMSTRVANSLARRRFLLELFGLFAATALTLAAIGIYGVVAHVVQIQTRAFGLRRALGAGDRAVLGWIFARSARHLVAGLVLGLPLAFAWARSLSAELYGIGTFDPFSVALTLAALAAIVSLATLIPARCALRIDPIVALRHE